jgi:hypothetical protein
LFALWNFPYSNTRTQLFLWNFPFS